MKKVLIYTISVFMVYALASCGEKTETSKTAEQTESDTIKEIIHPVRVMKIEKTQIKRTVYSTASLEAEKVTYLAPSMPGKIDDVKVDINDRVRKGQVLVQMDQSQLIQTQLQYENLKKDFARMDSLIRYGSVTQQAYDQMKTQLNVTKSALKNLQENTVLKAPYDGIVTGKYYNDEEIFAGAPNTQAGKAAILTLVKMDVLKVFINLSEKHLPLVKEGLTANLTTTVYPTDTIVAKVVRVYPTINAATRTFTVELRMDNPGYKLRPGMYSEVNLELGDRQALLVPSMAVIKQTGTNARYIFIHQNGTVKRTNVTLGERLDDKLELIPNGIKGGEELIYAGHQNLMDGDKVKIVKN